MTPIPHRGSHVKLSMKVATDRYSIGEIVLEIRETGTREEMMSREVLGPFATDGAAEVRSF